MPAFSGLMLALTALKRLYEGTAGLSILRQSLFPYWHCAGMNNQTARKAVSLRERGRTRACGARSSPPPSLFMASCQK
ncbi:hypothetical protein DVI67_24730 [Escherichia coli]|nr:hypothetical protein [Salmonella enterica subsp. enterica serovar Johannesburg]ECS1976632.1 hypothetical protein [Salmonella enterica subsp. enterica serovar Typhimurium var. 5-]ECS2846043.1 hypothetical protein [Salmonella enterica subsp. enterica serovar Heidelberg]EFO1182943.1 hypothetical protein [Escherichia coli]EFO1762767.1 hypothetical protein [Escherichia coli]